MGYGRGSEWRKWDLHVHTATSYDSYRGMDADELLVEAWRAHNFAAVAITDHFTIDAERIQRLRRLAPEITIFPGFEMRTDKGAPNLHVVGIFPEIADLSTLSNDFEAILIRQHRKDGETEDTIVRDLHDIVDFVKKGNGVLTIHAGKKTNGIDKEITNALPVAQAIKKDISEVIDIFEIGQVADVDSYEQKVFKCVPEKPLILCSDNHNPRNYNVKKYLWIKADPTFQGLKQIINEPSERVFIGEMPPVLKRVKNNSTKYLKAVKITTIPGKTDDDEIWFRDIEIPLNKELVTIIGNKGSGKSAVADIIGLCADAEHASHFQFLRGERFLKRGYADRFSGQLEFFSNTVTEGRILSDAIDPSAVPRVQYLPQSYFETICNELGTVTGFRREVEKVVFQYIPEEQKLGKASFEELMAYKHQAVVAEIHGFRNKIRVLNDEIIDLENKEDPAERETLENKERVKKDELEVHNASKPTEIPKPADEGESLSPQGKELRRWEEEKEKWTDQLTQTEARVNLLAIQIEELNRLQREFSQKHNEVTEFMIERAEILAGYGIDVSQLFRIEFDTQPLIDLIENKGHERRQLSEELGGQTVSDDAVFDDLKIRGRVSYCESQINKILTQLSQEEQVYQKYLAEHAEWLEQLNRIIGDNKTPDSLKYYGARLAYIRDQLESDLIEKRQERIILSMGIYGKKLELKSFYDQIKAAIDEQLASFEGISLHIDTSLMLDSDFVESFMGFVDKSRQGSFRGVIEGKERLDRLIEPVNWNNAEQVEKILNDAIDHLEHDYRGNVNGGSTFIGKQIPKRKEFYDFLFSLDYLDPVYELKQGEKTLEELSPGEKGALLLIFYLTLDKSDIPLLIDQPEDNLDNKSVATVLVPYIKMAKKRRQIVMVTHNPNLAVVADAEQVIRVDIDKESGNKFSFISGGIENGEINKAIVEVLEGTMPAFTARKNKYRN